MDKLKVISAAVVLGLTVAAQAQKKPDYNKYSNFRYNVYEYESDHRTTSYTMVDRVGNISVIYDQEVTEHPVPGLANERMMADYVKDSLTYDLVYDTVVYRAKVPMRRSGIEWDSVRVDKSRMKYICSVNSNRLEFVIEDSRHCINPLPQYGLDRGVLVEFWRNGQLRMELKTWDNAPSQSMLRALMAENVVRVEARELDNIKRQRLVLTTRVFDDVQLSWGQKNDSVVAGLSSDTLLHFAGGTLALRRLHLQALPQHYQTFVEIRQRSNGDAYDRTGSLFVIPQRRLHSFLEGLNDPKRLPILKGSDGEQYQGVVATESYEPLVELVRFFTPFGVGHFNDRVKIDGLDWNEETYYKQEVSDMAEVLQGDVWMGVWIGNYDGGGHKVTVDLKSYPGDYEWKDAGIVSEVVPLFNTCNVLEMAGQNYGKMFGSDSLKIRFEVPEGGRHMQLRYITTGHGGWGGGDEFNPKTNTIRVDGEKVGEYTPWRQDCGRYREWNPVSGNFWDGMSSSDYSRSGWCPGTATQPVYFNLDGLEPGWHTMTVSIPQGAPMEGSFSAWNVSGVLVIER